MTTPNTNPEQPKPIDSRLAEELGWASLELAQGDPPLARPGPEPPKPDIVESIRFPKSLLTPKPPTTPEV